MLTDEDTPTIRGTIVRHPRVTVWDRLMVVKVDWWIIGGVAILVGGASFGYAMAQLGFKKGTGMGIGLVIGAVYYIGQWAIRKWWPK